MSAVSAAEAAEESRFNAGKHYFTGEHIVVDESQLPRYREILEGFTARYKPGDDPEAQFLVAELAKAAFQVERLEALIARTATEKDPLCDELRLLNRYLKEHRRNFYRAKNEMNTQRRIANQEALIEFKFKHNGPLSHFQAQTRRIEVAGRASETSLFKSNPSDFNYLREIIGIRPVSAAAAGPPRQ